MSRWSSSVERERNYRHGGIFRRAAIPVLVVSLISLVGACSSSGSPGTGSGDNSSGSSSGAPIKLGSIVSATGNFSDPLSGDIADAWAKWTNAHGGINGHPVQLTVLDDGSNPASALSDAKQLVQQNHVIAVVGNSPTGASAVADYLDSVHVPAIGAAFAAEYSGRYLFPASTSQSAINLALFRTAKAEGLTKVADFYCAEVPACATLVAQDKKSASIVGIPDVFEGSILASAPDYTSLCLKMISSGANATIVGALENVAARVIPACDEQGYKGAWILDSPTVDPAWDKQAAYSGARIYVVNNTWNWSDQTTSQQRDYFQAIQQFAPNVLTDPGYSANEQLVWVAFQMFAAAAAAANIGPSSTPADVVGGLYKLHDETLGDTTGPISYVRSAATQTDPCYFVMKLANGKWVNPQGAKSQCVADLNG